MGKINKDIEFRNCWLKDVTLVKEPFPLAIYQQLANSIVERIADATILENDVLPSINQLSSYFAVSRNTVEKAYSHLKEIGYVKSTRSKAYYVCRTATTKNGALFDPLDDLSHLFAHIDKLQKDDLIILKKFVNKTFNRRSKHDIYQRIID
ncbi:MAG: winged helix-turn-helix domain-containing protein [Dyadobacter sp.]|uniref:GntR family transcriptional regulator n=1 Tax=Dyadobacter sp. TaxID=1914288 RepID=UPI003266A428